MTITLNGQPIELDAGTTVTQLLASRQLAADRVAVELNRRLLRGDRYDSPLNDRDEVEIVTFVGGG